MPVRSMEQNAKKRRNLTIKEKHDIVNKIDKGLSKKQIASAYGITVRAVSRIYGNKEKIQQLSATITTKDASERKSLKRPMDELLEEAVLKWIYQQRAMKREISGPLLVEAALDLNEKMGGKANFKASRGWMEKFKKRNGLKFYIEEGESLSTDVEAAKHFSDDFKRFIGENGYSTHDLYNADESGVNWRSLPRKTLVTNEENSAIEAMVLKDRITALFCANASGSHKLPIVVIGKYENLRWLKNDEDLPVIYKSQSSSWMDRIVFRDWYENNFIPLVKEEQKRTGRLGKVLLLLDNAPSHPPEEDLNKIDDNFRVMFLPPNVTSLIQPMDQHVIATVKKSYKKSMTRKLLNSNCTVNEFLETFNLEDCCYLIATAWTNVSSSTLARAWKQLIKSEESSSQSSENTTEENNESCNLIDFTAMMNDALGCTIDEREIDLWLCEDNVDCGWEPLSNQEIITEVISHQILENLQANEESSGVEEKFCVDENSASVFAQKAVQSLDFAYSWFVQQDECASSDLETLSRIRDIAMSKSLTP